ncbi:MAG: hypothetical protein K8R77_07670 [Anaerolineaceae bacterium]|nr:hypothetical protein [Anaerolineaceae bacterium]
MKNIRKYRTREAQSHASGARNVRCALCLFSRLHGRQDFCLLHVELILSYQSRFKQLI